MTEVIGNKDLQEQKEEERESVKAKMERNQQTTGLIRYQVKYSYEPMNVHRRIIAQRTIDQFGISRTRFSMNAH